MSIKVVNYHAPQAAEEFTQSLREIGFAVLSHHPINVKLMDEAYQQWQQFFFSDEKHQYAFDNKTHDGFISMGLSETAKGYSIKDIKEFYHYYPVGRCPSSLKSVTQQLYQELSTLAQHLLAWIEQHTPENISRQFSMPLSEMIKGSEKTLFRLIHYPPLTGQEEAGAVRAAAHEDINLITLLPAATAKGLEVKNTRGEWVEVPCESGWIIVNTGDMLQECTQAHYPSTTHRVINPNDASANQSRLSMPLFLHPCDDVRLSERHTARSYRAERYKELGLS